MCLRLHIHACTDAHMCVHVHSALTEQDEPQELAKLQMYLNFFRRAAIEMPRSRLVIRRQCTGIHGAGPSLRVHSV